MIRTWKTRESDIYAHKCTSTCIHAPVNLDRVDREGFSEAMVFELRPQ